MTYDASKSRISVIDIWFRMDGTIESWITENFGILSRLDIIYLLYSK